MLSLLGLHCLIHACLNFILLFYGDGGQEVLLDNPIILMHIFSSGVSEVLLEFLFFSYLLFGISLKVTAIAIVAVDHVCRIILRLLDLFLELHLKLRLVLFLFFLESYGNGAERLLELNATGLKLQIDFMLVGPLKLVGALNVFFIGSECLLNFGMKSILGFAPLAEVGFHVLLRLALV